jgi:hypothetical protein
VNQQRITAASDFFNKIGGLCSLMGQGGALLGFRRLGMPVFSARSQALDGVSWVQGG